MIDIDKNKAIFETFSPKSALVKKYVDYYYLDIKPHNEVREYQCFPHYNNTISIYASHQLKSDGSMEFKEGANDYQIFTPIREDVLHVRQIGRVHRVVIVFHPLGIQQFYRHLRFVHLIENYKFLEEEEVTEVFDTTNVETLTTLLDALLEKRYQPFSNALLEQTIAHIFKGEDNFAVQELAARLGVSRQHLNRVFKANMGVSLKRFYDIYLFRKTVNQKLYIAPEEKLTTIACRFNFNDQSHLIKTYKAMTNTSPKDFFQKGTKLGTKDTFWHLEQ
ncbi:helix-turn-helix domain-containing protein [Myroides sp. DF42-4-2]|uniref:helix-turn-helix domain-containing protein n=1 Tax=Myroides sp. DF42-4-2 TaxID=2746726 RepID=UPI002577B4E2|nr:helix-turn-helix domain-containing protein [Myroides sp. DF42-4-2]MDM1408200.1 AraC family transcriptional regulator [Myroides sp. DF42-4-2]